MAINLKAEPYNDDFDEKKNFYQILFRPGYSVQARELTQIQTILRDQIAKFGNHIFKHGSIVIPGHSAAETGIPYIKLESTYNDLAIDTSQFIDKVVIGAQSGVKGIVKKIVPASGGDPLTFYVNYISGGVDSEGNPNGNVTFVAGTSEANGEEIYLSTDNTIRATVRSGTDSIGVGGLAHISAGVYYINGSFVYVEKQSAPLTGVVGGNNTKYTVTPNCHVLLKIVESIVDHTQDESLLDNAQGAYNYAAPGADRLKIYLELTTLPLGSTITNDYVEIMRYRDGVLEEHAKNARYSELEKSLARRTFDESGDYVVSGLQPELKEHLKKELNEGVYSASAGGDSSKFVMDVSRGKAYIRGFETEKIAPTRIIADKARSTSVTNATLKPTYGQYLIISDPKGPLSINSAGSPEGGSEIDLYDTAPDLTTAVGTSWTATSAVTTGTKYSTAEGKTYEAENNGVTGAVPPTHVTTTSAVPNATLWTPDTEISTTTTYVDTLGATITVDNYIYYADRLYRVAAAGKTGLTPPVHNTGTEINSSQGEWDNYRRVSIGDNFYYNDRNPNPDVQRLYAVIQPPNSGAGTGTQNNTPTAERMITGHWGGIYGGALTTGTASTTVVSGGNYSEAVTVKVSDPDHPEGVAATATATLTGTAVTSVNIVTAGSGYTRPPIITIVRSETDTGTSAAVVTYTGAITAASPGVEPVFGVATPITGITQYVAAAYTTSVISGVTVGSGNGTITATVGNASAIANLQVGEYITISGASGTQQTKLNGTWVVASKPTATTFTFYTDTALTAGTYTSGIGSCTTIGRMINAKMWQDRMLVTKGDHIWVKGASGKPNRVYLVDTVVANTGLHASGLSNVLGTSAPTHTNATLTANGNVNLLYMGSPACLQYAGSPTTLTYAGVPAKFRFQGVTGAKIGSARVLGIDYFLGDPGTSAAIYKLWVTDVKLSSFTNSLEEIGSIKYNNGNDYAFALTSFEVPLTTGGFTPGELVVHAGSGRTAVAKYYNAPTGTLYAYRNNASVDSPAKGDEIKGQTSNTVGVVQKKTPIISEGQPSLIFNLPKEIPASLKRTSGSEFDFRYVVTREFVIEVVSGTGSASITNGQILPIEAGSFLALGENGVIPNSNFSLSSDKTITASGITNPSTQTVRVYASVLKQNTEDFFLQPKTKAIATFTQTFDYWTAGGTPNQGDYVFYGDNLYEVTTAGTFQENGEDPAIPPSHTSGTSTNGTVSLKYISSMARITLAKADLISLTSVVSSSGDITGNYTILNGQTDYAYLRGTLVRSSAALNPTSSITVTYQYYNHLGSGDFFCVDSYTEGAVSAIEKKIIYQSESTGTKYDLTACVDFRPTQGADGTFGSGSASKNDLIISGTTFETDLQYYIPRIDALVVDQTGELTLIKGASDEKPVEPAIPLDKFELNRFYIPAFTRSVTDIQVKRMDVERFTMKDIKNIVNRVERIEEFSTLTASEVAVTSYEIKDAATGLNRFKSGYLVETFKNPFTIARTTDGDYAASFVGEVLASPVEELICDLQLLNQSTRVSAQNYEGDGFVIKGGCLMLPYTEEVFAQQPLSSRVTNLNPFLVVKWDGIVVCDPPSDFWVETMQLPTIFEKVNETITVRWNSPVPEVERTTTFRSTNPGLTAAQRQVKPSPIELVAYRITQPDGHSYTTVGAPGKYDKPGDARVEVIGSTTINQRADGTSTTRAIDDAAKKLGGRNVVITDDVYRQIIHARTSDALFLNDAFQKRS